MRRFSIRSIMALIVIAAFGLAAIRVASSSWAGATSSIAFFSMTCALLGVAFGRNERRIYWTGFAALGWTYLVLSYSPWTEGKIGGHLFAPGLFGYLAEVLHAEPPPPAAGGFQSVPPGPLGAAVIAGGGGFGGRVGLGGGVSYEVQMNCVRIGRSMEALLWAILGGWVALYFASGKNGVIGALAASDGVARPIGRDEAGHAN